MRVSTGSLVALTLARLAVAQSASPIVDVGYAKYQGFYNQSIDINTFFGIRYAQPPTGDLRWRAPQPIEKNNSYSPSRVINASVEGPICIQGTPEWKTGIHDTPIGVEDCLLLDVLVPAHPASTSLPVIVEIHGGGYTQGGSEYYPGWPLVQQSRGNIILVNIQYRLSALGFLNSAEIRANGAANAGILDQRLALEWVQRHISAFGGDPARVTISGGSAGGGSVTAQMIAYGGDPDPPFRGVIAEYPWWMQYHSPDILEAQYRQMLQASKCDSLACLRSLNETALATATQQIYYLGYNGSATRWYGYGDYYFGPSVDGTLLRDLPSQEFKQGHFTKVPLLTTRDGYEGVSFSNTSETTQADQQADFQTLWPTAAPSFWNRLYQLYPRDSFNSTFFQRQQIFGDFIINCPTYYMATAVSNYGLPVWKQLFNAGSQLHGATAHIIFNNTYGLPGAQDTSSNNGTMDRILIDWYLSFVIEQDPNAISYSNISKPFWPEYLQTGAPGTGGTFMINEVNVTDIGVLQDPDASAQCDFWHGQSYVVRN